LVSTGALTVILRREVEGDGFEELREQRARDIKTEMI